MRTRVKICGITREADLQAAVEAGADAIGLVFYAPSPRNVSLRQAAALARACPPMVTRFGLFVDPEPESLAATLDTVEIDVTQFHGAESPEFCASAGRRWVKALRVHDEADLVAEYRRYAGAGALLLDAWVHDKPGGTGRRFAWERLPVAPDTRIILAGGLEPGNVGAAVSVVRPYAVDVSSGVEREPGIKDPALIRRFITAVREADEARDASRSASTGGSARYADSDGIASR